MLGSIVFMMCLDLLLYVNTPMQFTPVYTAVKMKENSDDKKKKDIFS